jgi:type IV secretory pathway TrbF-like protein
METRGIKRSMDMNKKVMVLAGLIVALVAVGYALYNSFSQLKDIDYDLFETDEEENDD